MEGKIRRFVLVLFAIAAVVSGEDPLAEDDDSFHINIEQAEVLLDWRLHFKDSSNSLSTWHWNNVENVCSTGGKSWRGVKCDSSGSINELDLQDFGLLGELTGKITLLPRLEILRLRGNHFIGTVPDISEMKYLRVLDLSENNLEGALPFEKLSFWITPAGNALEEIHLERNGFSGHFVDDLEQSFTIESPIRVILAAKNDYHGKLSKDWSRLQHLEQIDLSMNELEGEIPISWTTLTNLTHLDLRGNRGLCGELPAFSPITSIPDGWLNNQTCDLPIDTTEIEASLLLAIKNQLKPRNSVEYVLENWNPHNKKDLCRDWERIECEDGRVTRLDLSLLDLRGRIQSDFFKLEKLQELSLSHNRLRGRIPKEISSAPSLKQLKLDHNPDLCGPIDKLSHGLKVHLTGTRIGVLCRDKRRVEWVNATTPRIFSSQAIRRSEFDGLQVQIPTTSVEALFPEESAENDLTTPISSQNNDSQLPFSVGPESDSAPSSKASSSDSASISGPPDLQPEEEITISSFNTTDPRFSSLSSNQPSSFNGDGEEEAFEKREISSQAVAWAVISLILGILAIILVYLCILRRSHFAEIKASMSNNKKGKGAEKTKSGKTGKETTSPKSLWKQKYSQLAQSITRATFIPGSKQSDSAINKNQNDSEMLASKDTSSAVKSSAKKKDEEEPSELGKSAGFSLGSLRRKSFSFSRTNEAFQPMKTDAAASQKRSWIQRAFTSFSKNKQENDPARNETEQSEQRPDVALHGIQTEDSRNRLTLNTTESQQRMFDNPLSSMQDPMMTKLNFNDSLLKDFNVLHQNDLYSEQTLNSELSVVSEGLARQESEFHSVDEEADTTKIAPSDLLKTRQPDFVVNLGTLMQTSDSVRLRPTSTERAELDLQKRDASTWSITDNFSKGTEVAAPQDGNESTYSESDISVHCF